MKKLLMAALALALPALAPCDPAPGAPSAAALELVSLIRFDKTVSQASASAARKAFAEKKLTQAQFNCSILPVSAWTEPLARYFDQELSPTELAMAIRFFKSDSGHSIRNAMTMAEWGDDRALEKAMDDETRSFLSTSAGKKLYSKDSILQSADMQELTGRRMREALANCPAQ